MFFFLPPVIKKVLPVSIPTSCNFMCLLKIHHKFDNERHAGLTPRMKQDVF